jgi:hypothetical protein
MADPWQLRCWCLFAAISSPLPAIHHLVEDAAQGPHVTGPPNFHGWCSKDVVCPPQDGLRGHVVQRANLPGSTWEAEAWLKRSGVTIMMYEHQSRLHDKGDQGAADCMQSHHSSAEAAALLRLSLLLPSSYL